MLLNLSHPRPRWLAAATFPALLIAVVALASGAPSRHALLAQLERPAAAAGSARSAKVVEQPPPYRLAVALTPNRASVADAVIAQLTDAGVPLTGARVTMTFSMPAMNMWHVLTVDAKPAGRGGYAATIPVLGMAGDWQIVLRVTRRRSRPLAFTVISHLTA